MTTTPPLTIEYPIIFGILNVTPDSFSDGGEHLSTKNALRHFEMLLSSGAHFVDIGAESTRPGADPVDEDIEWERLKGVLNALSGNSMIEKVSIDTRKFNVMLRAASLGCRWINCVGALPTVDELKQLKDVNPSLRFIASHMHGNPKNMQVSPLNSPKVTRRVEEYFEVSHLELLEGGFRPQEIYLDPGIGFGKTDASNIALLARTPAWSRVYNLALGVSRKGIFSRLFGCKDNREKDLASKVVELALSICGAKVIRTHDVAGLSQSIRLSAYEVNA